MDSNVKGGYSYNALHWACQGGHTALAKWLIQTCNMDPNVKDKNNQNALHCACQEGHMELAKWLIQTCNMDPKIKDRSDNNALDLAKKSQNKHQALIYWLTQWMGNAEKEREEEKEKGLIHAIESSAKTPCYSWHSRNNQAE